MGGLSLPAWEGSVLPQDVLHYLPIDLILTPLGPHFDTPGTSFWPPGAPDFPTMEPSTSQSEVMDGLGTFPVGNPTPLWPPLWHIGWTKHAKRRQKARQNRNLRTEPYTGLLQDAEYGFCTINNILLATRAGPNESSFLVAYGGILGRLGDTCGPKGAKRRFQKRLQKQGAKKHRGQIKVDFLNTFNEGEGKYT